MGLILSCFFKYFLRVFLSLKNILKLEREKGYGEKSDWVDEKIPG